MTLTDTMPSPPRASTTPSLQVALADARACLNACEPPPRVAAAIWQARGLQRPIAAEPLGHGQRLWHAAWTHRWALMVTLLIAAMLAGLQEAAQPDVPAWHEPELSRGFLPVRDLSVLPASTDAWLMHTVMPVQKAMDYGLPFDPSHATDTVAVDMLVAANGDLLALRLAP